MYRWDVLKTVKHVDKQSLYSLPEYIPFLEHKFDFGSNLPLVALPETSFHRKERDSQSGDGWRVTWICKVELLQSKTCVCLCCPESVCVQYDCIICYAFILVNIPVSSWYHIILWHHQHLKSSFLMSCYNSVNAVVFWMLKSEKSLYCNNTWNHWGLQLAEVLKIRLSCDMSKH